ncbi:MAG: gluconokinase, partial [Actinomycetales bacterium]
MTITGTRTSEGAAGPGEPSGTRHLVVMGVSGCGKTTLARALSAATGMRFLEADDLHPQENVAKMAAGVPLDDDDRWPWLGALSRWMHERAAADESTV